MGKSKSTTSFSASSPDTWASLLTIDQVSKILNVSTWTLRQWDSQNKLIAVRVGSRRDRRYRKEDIVNILKEGL